MPNDRGARRFAALLIVLAGFAIAATPSLAQQNACSREADSIRRAEGQLPRIEVAPPDDQQIVCITLETNIVFARRVAAHLANCPRSPLARQGDTWRRTESDYMGRFSERRCKTAIRNYRG